MEVLPMEGTHLFRYDLSTDVASAGVRIEIDTSAETAIPAGEDITVTLKDWGLPSSIPTSSVLILGTTASQAAEPYSGEPSEVRIGSGNKVVLSLTPRYGNGEAAGPLFANQDYSIVFKQSAGITNPAKAGTAYVIKVDDSDTEDCNSNVRSYRDQEQGHSCEVVRSPWHAG